MGEGEHVRKVLLYKQEEPFRLRRALKTTEN